MPNHFHFFLQIKELPFSLKDSKLSPVEKAFKDFFISYAKSINKKYDRTGALFQYKFKRNDVDNLEYYTWLPYYMHLNPVKAGLCKKFEDWNFSSYKAILTDSPTLVERVEILNWFGGKDGFIHFHEANLLERRNNQDFLKKFKI
jgi:hypothetical protein